MAIDSNLEFTVYVRDVIDRNMLMNPYGMVVQDRTAQLAGREQMIIGDLKSAVTISDEDAIANDADWGTSTNPDTKAFTLVANKRHRWAKRVASLDELEIGPNLSANLQQWIGNAYQLTVGKDIRLAVEAATPAETATTLAFKTDGTSGSVTTLKNVAGGEAIVDVFLNNMTFADQMNWPRPGRVFIGQASITNAIIRYLTTRATDYAAGLAQSAFMGMQLPMVHGWTILTDPTVSDKSNAAAANLFKGQFFMANRTIMWARQMLDTFVIPPGYTGGNYTNFLGDMKYGTLVPSLGVSKADDSTATTETLLSMDITFT